MTPYDTLRHPGLARLEEPAQQLLHVGARLDRRGVRLAARDAAEGLSLALRDPVRQRPTPVPPPLRRLRPTAAGSSSGLRRRRTVVGRGARGGGGGLADEAIIRERLRLVARRDLAREAARGAVAPV